MILTATTDPDTRGLMAVFFAAITLAPALLLVLMLNKGQDLRAQDDRFDAATITGRLVACKGYEISVGTPMLLAVRADAVDIAFGRSELIRVPFDEVLAVEFGGPGTQVQSGTFFGGGVAIGPVILGSASASTKKTTDTFVHVSTSLGAFTVHTDEADPIELEAIFAAALLA